jgi:hypothetical protein
MAETTTAAAATAMPTWKVAPEVALQDFNRMCTARRIDLDETEWTDAEKKEFDSYRKFICKKISSGEVAIDVNNDPVLSFLPPPNGPLKLGKPKGSAILAQDGKIENARVFAALADISGLAVSHFSNFDLQDIHLLKIFYVLFFQR